MRIREWKLRQNIHERVHGNVKLRIKPCVQNRSQQRMHQKQWANKWEGLGKRRKNKHQHLGTWWFVSRNLNKLPNNWGIIEKPRIEGWWKSMEKKFVRLGILLLDYFPNTITRINGRKIVKKYLSACNDVAISVIMNKRKTRVYMALADGEFSVNYRCRMRGKYYYCKCCSFESLGESETKSRLIGLIDTWRHVSGCVSFKLDVWRTSMSPVNASSA